MPMKTNHSHSILYLSPLIESSIFTTVASMGTSLPLETISRCFAASAYANALDGLLDVYSFERTSFIVTDLFLSFLRFKEFIRNPSLVGHAGGGLLVSCRT